MDDLNPVGKTLPEYIAVCTGFEVGVFEHIIDKWNEANPSCNGYTAEDVFVFNDLGEGEPNRDSFFPLLRDNPQHMQMAVSVIRYMQRRFEQDWNAEDFIMEHLGYLCKQHGIKRLDEATPTGYTPERLLEYWGIEPEAA